MMAKNPASVSRSHNGICILPLQHDKVESIMILGIDEFYLCPAE